jgi:hypothetical protein
MLPTKTFLALTMLMAGALAVSSAEPNDPNSVDIVPEIDSDDIIVPDVEAVPEAELNKRKGEACKCARASHPIDRHLRKVRVVGS